MINNVITSNYKRFGYWIYPDGYILLCNNDIDHLEIIKNKSFNIYKYLNIDSNLDISTIPNILTEIYKYNFIRITIFNNQVGIDFYEKLNSKQIENIVKTLKNYVKSYLNYTIYLNIIKFNKVILITDIYQLYEILEKYL